MVEPIKDEEVSITTNYKSPIVEKDDYQRTYGIERRDEKGTCCLKERYSFNLLPKLSLSF